MNNSTLISSIKISDIHPSWIRSVPNGQLVSKLLENPASKAATARIIDQYLDIEKIDLSSTEGVIKKLHLTSSADMQDIVLKAGAVQLSHTVRRLIDQQDVRKVRNSLGKELYNFALHEVPITFPSMPVLPNIYTFNLNPIVHFIDAGYCSLRIVSQGAPNNFYLKLPKNWGIGYFSKKKEGRVTEKKIDKDFHMSLFSELIQMNER